jgi:uncharacterized membrane protein
MKWILIVSILLEAAVMMLLPYLSPRPLYFGVRTGVAFRESQAGRKIRGLYWGRVIASAGIGMAVLPFVPTLPFIVMLPIVISFVAFGLAYFQARPHALHAPEVREAELTDEPALPRWSWLALPPFAIPLAVLQYLRAHYDQIPARYPVHFNLAGEPDRWVEKSARAVFAPVWFSEGMLLLFLMLLAAVLIGSRRRVRPSAIPGIFVVVMYLIGFVFTSIALMPIVQLPPVVTIGPTLAFVAAVLVIGYRRNADPNAPVETTPDECWTLGSFYVNPNDPAIFVQRRIGFGYTLNFGNVWTYVVMGAFAMGMAVLAMFLKWANGA